MKKILVVDDDSDILLLLKNHFSFRHYEVRTTMSCDEGLDIFYAFAPDLVLMDVNVGNADGRIMCRTIKAQAAYQHIPVILMSANPQGLVSYHDYGASAAIEKPFNLPLLTAKVHDCLQR